MRSIFYSHYLSISFKNCIISLILVKISFAPKCLKLFIIELKSAPGAITPIVSISSQKLIDENWDEIGDYPYKIWWYSDYIRLQNPIRFKNKYQFLKLNVSCWYFAQNEVPVMIKQFIAKVWAKLQEEAKEAWKVVDWQSSIATWWKTSLRLWDYSVWFAQGWVLSSQITAWLSNLAVQIWWTWELDMIYSKYWKPFIWMI